MLALDGIYYYGYASPKYGYASPKLNPDLLQLPLWAGAVLLLHTALTSRRLAAWLGFGLLVGLGVLAKYYTIALVVALLPVLLVTTEGRRSWRTPGPWLAALVAFAVVAPHLVWLAEMDFISLRYAQARAQSDIAALQRVTEPASFLAGRSRSPFRFCFSCWWLGGVRASFGRADWRLWTELCFWPRASARCSSPWPPEPSSVSG